MKRPQEKNDNTEQSEEITLVEQISEVTMNGDCSNTKELEEELLDESLLEIAINPKEMEGIVEL